MTKREIEIQAAANYLLHAMRGMSVSHMKAVLGQVTTFIEDEATIAQTTLGSMFSYSPVGTKEVQDASLTGSLSVFAGTLGQAGQTNMSDRHRSNTLSTGASHPSPLPSRTSAEPSADHHDDMRGI